MDKLIKKSQKFWLESADYRFSPLMKVSATISLEYCNQIDNINAPLLFTFPNKSLSSLWLSVSLLTNFYFEDYIENSILKLEEKFKKGDKIKIHDTIAEVEKVGNETLIIAFKNNPGIEISTKNIKFFDSISVVEKSRKLQLLTRFNKLKKKSKEERNVISRILEPKNNVKINQENLKSKILLIAGNGNVKRIKESLYNEKIYNVELMKIFPEGKNLIIRKDLKSYIVDDNLYESKLKIFSANFKKFIEISDSDLLRSCLTDLLIDDKVCINKHFDEVFNAIIEDFIDEEPNLMKLFAIYPGVSDKIPKDLKAIIINDITQYIIYKNTIDYFISKDIPVIFVTDRKIDKSDEINYFDKLFDLYPEFNRVNWNQSKIRKLINFDEDLPFLDNKLWKIAKRYSIQNIVIDAQYKHDLDKLIPKLSMLIRNIEGFEDLQLSYFKNLYRVLFALKNSGSTSDIIHKLVNEFEISYISVKDSGLSNELRVLIDKVIRISKDFRGNSKLIQINDKVFSQIFLEKEENKYFIPIGSKGKSEIIGFDSIQFSGYPYNEYSGKYLINSIFKNYFSNVKLTCWEFEGDMTFKYLRRRLVASYFVENINFKTEFNRDLLLSNEDIQLEVDSMLKIKLNNTMLIDYELPIDETVDSDLYKFRYKNYHVTDSSLDFVNCNIINFIDDSFMFLSKTGKILAEVEDDNGNISIREASFSELSNGSRVFKYKRDRETYRKIVSHNKKLTENIDDLYQWKEYLLSLYYKYDKNIATLQNFLQEIKENNGLKESNPTRQNIRRWIFDESTLKPSKHNVELFLLASAINSEEINIKLNQMEEAYSSVNGFIISLSSKMKKKISETDLAENINTFEIIEQGFPILVETKRIFSLEESNVPIEYSNTRQILYANS